MSSSADLGETQLILGNPTSESEGSSWVIWRLVTVARHASYLLPMVSDHPADYLRMFFPR